MCLDTIDEVSKDLLDLAEFAQESCPEFADAFDLECEVVGYKFMQRLGGSLYAFVRPNGCLREHLPAPTVNEAVQISIGCADEWVRYPSGFHAYQRRDVALAMADGRRVIPWASLRMPGLELWKVKLGGLVIWGRQDGDVAIVGSKMLLVEKVWPVAEQPETTESEYVRDDEITADIEVLEPVGATS